MNFKKISVASIGLAALLFSCGGKKELKREEMQDEIKANFKMSLIEEKYVAGKKIKVTGTVKDEKIDKTYTLKEGCIEIDDDLHTINFGDDEENGNHYVMIILDLSTFGSLPESGVKFYKISNGYSISAAEGPVVGEITFDKEFVSTSMKNTEDGKTQILTYTYLG